MSTRLRVSTSGPIATAADVGGAGAIGQFLRRLANPVPGQPDTVGWAAVPPATVALLSNVIFVDLGTATPVPSQNGSIGSPFATLTAAIAAVPTDGCIVIAPGDYSPEGALVLPDKNMTWVNWATQGFELANHPSFATSLVFTGDVTVFNGDVLVTTGVHLGTVTLGTAATKLNVNSGNVAAIAGSGQAHICNADVLGNVAATGFLLQNGNLFGAAVAINNAGFAFCDFRKAAFNNLTTITFSAPGGLVTLDAETNDSATSTGGLFGLTVVNGVSQVVGSLGRAVLSVIVPAVLDGQVGYVDVDTAGTELAALVTGAGVVCNPSADLVAAGAGGGYINCRVPAAHTVRLAFIGALAGGASDFTITSLQNQI